MEKVEKEQKQQKEQMKEGKRPTDIEMIKQTTAEQLVELQILSNAVDVFIREQRETNRLLKQIDMSLMALVAASKKIAEGLKTAKMPAPRAPSKYQYKAYDEHTGADADNEIKWDYDRIEDFRAAYPPTRCHGCAREVMYGVSKKNGKPYVRIYCPECNEGFFLGHKKVAECIK